MSQRTLFTIGHSTRAWLSFVALLRAWNIKTLVDVRTLPRSRAFPWFDGKCLGGSLPRIGITYLAIPVLGGLRRPNHETANAGWHNVRFRAYADYMQSSDFAIGLEELNAQRKTSRVCVMCAEAVWWRCHRRLIADAEVARGIPVKHIMTESLAPPHELTTFARVTKRRGKPPTVTYPQEN